MWSLVVVGAVQLSRPKTALCASARYEAPGDEIERRRNLAVCAHPDAGKTTLTEKLLLYGDAVQEAGAVRARANRRKSTSDFMSMERERGISISSTCLSFEYSDVRMNLMDTPGHADFSEDTYRTLCASDNAVMLIDGGKGLEDMTRKLFAVARRSELPVFTFVNKMDRPAKSPWDIVDEIEKEFEIGVVPRTWPVGDGDRFRGIYDVERRELVLYERGKAGKKASKSRLAIDDPSIQDVLDADLYEQLVEDKEMIEELTAALDTDQLYAGKQTAVYFGSAMSDFGVADFLDEFVVLGSRPRPRKLRNDQSVDPSAPRFTAIVFKLQANLDPRHRDCMAFARIVSGTFEKGMKVTHRRSGRALTLSNAAMLFGQGRETVECAYPGDVVGLNNPAGGLFQIGDAIYSGNAALDFEPIPQFSPECFAYLRPSAIGQSTKAFDKGLAQMLSEGAITKLQACSPGASSEPLLAAVGELQFEVVVDRLLNEYGVSTTLDRLSFNIARWVQPDQPADRAWAALDDAKRAGALASVFIAKDIWDRPVLLFRNAYTADRIQNDPELQLDLKPWALPPILATH